ncbi:PKHD-type hydroxylase [Iodidimonas nitroreducens]|uniref:PKHD-type hydroxylase n=1 Tax=Iodidimonas nitroreducens TaxID=1236968 RepID=A0A5A7N4H7_9PROT|nr:Fe2+-dependent dioxygenase [Iodidimonas nitroreducens]GAK32379.1 PKHD-type hydroxylase [alpha proteobacterium Q-1]GER03172.1 PKHD-type hydroxylase [Iodidimonas nitroreducens]
MFILISDALNSDDLSSLQKMLPELEYEPGAKTAGWHARAVKSNWQAKSSAARSHCQRRIKQALLEHPLFKAVALPARIADPLISRTAPGEGYGRHVDDALMGPALLRTDLSCTVFLNDPESYEGGELVLAGLGGEEAFKLPAGSLVLYPSTSLHWVEPVRSGLRFVAATWVESLVRDAGAREVLFDLGRVMEQLHQHEGKSESFDLIAKSRANLLRRWAGQ